MFLMHEDVFCIVARLNTTIGGSGNICSSLLNWCKIVKCFLRMECTSGSDFEKVITIKGTFVFFFLLYCKRQSLFNMSTFFNCSSVDELSFLLLCRCVFISSLLSCIFLLLKNFFKQEYQVHKVYIFDRIWMALRIIQVLVLICGFCLKICF